MLYNISVRRNIENIFQYLLMAVIVIYGQSVWIRLSQNLTSYIYIYLSLIATAILIILLLTRRVISTSGIGVAFILACLFLSEAIITKHGYILTVLRVIPPLSLFVIYIRTLMIYGDTYSLIKKYSDIVCILAFISLILFILGTILHLLPSQTITYYWAGAIRSCQTYYHFLYETQIEDFFGHFYVRNCGIFAEAPSYAVPLILSLYIEWFVSKKKNKTRSVILIATIITSFSTKALMIMCILIALKILQISYINKARKRYIQIIRIVVPILIISALYAMMLIYDQKTDSGSYISRINDISATLIAFKKSPLFGFGLGYEEAVSAFLSVTRAWNGFSMGATLLLAEGGIYITAIYIYSFIRALKRSTNKWIVISFTITYFGLLFTSNIPFFLSSLFIIALGYAVPTSKTSHLSNKINEEVLDSQSA